MIIAKEYNAENNKLFDKLEEILKNKTYCTFTYANANEIIKKYSNMVVNLQKATDAINEKDMSLAEAKTKYDIVLILDLEINSQEISTTLSKEEETIYKLLYCFTNEVIVPNIYHKIANPDYVINNNQEKVSIEEINNLLNGGKL